MIYDVKNGEEEHLTKMNAEGATMIGDILLDSGMKTMKDNERVRSFQG